MRSRCASWRWAGLLRQVGNYISQHPRGARTTVPESLSVIHPAFRFLPLTGKLGICGVAVPGGSCALRASGAAGFQPPAGVSRRPCGEVRKAPCPEVGVRPRERMLPRARDEGAGATPSCPALSWCWRPRCPASSRVGQD